MEREGGGGLKMGGVAGSLAPAAGRWRLLPVLLLLRRVVGKEPRCM